MQVVWQPNERQYDSVPAKPLSLDTSVMRPPWPCCCAKAIMSAVMARSAACLGAGARSSASQGICKHATPRQSCMCGLRRAPTGGC